MCRSHHSGSCPVLFGSMAGRWNEGRREGVPESFRQIYDKRASNNAAHWAVSPRSWSPACSEHICRFVFRFKFA